MSYRVNLGSDLRTRGSLWQMGAAPEKDALGQFPAVPKKVTDLWCSVVPQTGSLLTGRLADTQLSKTTHKVTVRFRRDITPDMWLVIDGQRYDILYILDPHLRHETLELFCEVRFDG